MKLTRSGIGGGTEASCCLVDEEAAEVAATLEEVANVTAGLNRAIRPVLAETPKSKRGDANIVFALPLEVLSLQLLIVQV